MARMLDRGTGSGRVVRSIVAIAAGKALMTLSGLLLVPLYLFEWSPTRYGEWLTLSATVGYLVLADLGMNMGAVNRLTQASARDARDEYRAVQRAALGFYVGVASLATLALGLAVMVLPLRRWLGIVDLTSREVALTTWLLGLVILWAMPSGVVTAAYRSTGDLATSQWVGNGHHVLTFLATAAALTAGVGPVSIAAAQLLTLILVTVGVLCHLRWRAPQLFPSIGRWPRGTLTSLLTPSLFFVMVVAANAIALQGSVIIVSVALGGAGVAMFVTLRTLANVIRQGVNTLVIALWPEVTRLEVERRTSALRAAHSLVVVVTTAMCIAIGAALWWEGSDVVATWTRGALRADVATLRLLLAFVVLQSPWLVGFGFLAASNQHTRASIACLASSAIGLVAAAVLVHGFGAAGVVAGLILGDLVACCHFVLRDSCALVGEPYGSFARRVWLNLVIVSSTALLAGWGAHVGIGGPSVFRWAVVGAATSTATAVAAWTLWLTVETREALTERLRPLAMAVVGVKA